MPRLVGKGKALELLLTGKTITSSEAYSLGVVEKVFDDDLLLKECYLLANKISKNAPIAILNTIKSVDKGYNEDIDSALNREAKLFSDLFNTDDAKNGMNSFINKEKSTFKGK